MGFSDLFLHFSGFAAPALTLALLMPLASRLVLPRRGPRVRYWPQVAGCLVTGLAVLAAGLWYFGHDGKVATYGALVLAVATAQWLMAGGWRR